MTARARARVTSTPGHQYTVDFPNQAFGHAHPPRREVRIFCPWSPRGLASKDHASLYFGGGDLAAHGASPGLKTPGNLKAPSAIYPPVFLRLILWCPPWAPPLRPSGPWGPWGVDRTRSRFREHVAPGGCFQ